MAQNIRGRGEGEGRRGESGRSHDRLVIREELVKIEERIAALKVLYEQHFIGIQPIAPDKEHDELKRLIRTVRDAPFHNSTTRFKLRVLESRYQTHNMYWQRVLKQREEGTYSRDLFRRDLRERIAFEDARSETSVGKAERGVEGLFSAYRTALERVTGKKQELDFDSFKKNLASTARELKKRGATSLSFKVVVSGSEVKIKAVERKKPQGGATGTKVGEE